MMWIIAAFLSLVILVLVSIGLKATDKTTAKVEVWLIVGLLILALIGAVLLGVFLFGG